LGAGGFRHCGWSGVVPWSQRGEGRLNGQSEGPQIPAAADSPHPKTVGPKLRQARLPSDNSIDYPTD
jgi:hypothetical protein